MNPFYVLAIDERLLPAVRKLYTQVCTQDRPAGRAASLMYSVGEVEPGLEQVELDWAVFATQVLGRAPGSAARLTQASAGNGVAVVPIEGILAGRQLQQVRQEFRAALANPEVGAILLAVDSPGGSVYGVDELASEIYQARARKRILAQVEPLAASAAYYLASQAEEIAVAPTGELGSIGVYAMHVDLSGFLDQLGFKVSLISAGKYKTEGSPFGPLGEEARAFLQSRVDDYYAMFADAVARGRGVKVEQVRSGMGEGRVVGAAQALALGMADRVATFDQTLARMREEMASEKVVVPRAAATGAPVEKTPAPAGSAGAAASSAPTKPASAEKTMEVPQMSTVAVAPAAQAGAADPVALAQQRAARITTLALAHGQPEKAAAWIQGTATIEQVQAELLAGYEARPLPGASAPVVVTEDAADKKPRSLVLAACARALAHSRGNKLEASKFAAETLKDPAAARYLAMGASTGSAGGFWVPEALSADLIEVLRPMTALRSLNPVLAPMPNGSLTLPKIAGGATATYIGEQQNAVKSDVSAGQVKASAKKLSCVVPVSNDLIRYASVAADAVVRDDMAAAAAQAEDSAFIRGSGTAYTPKGLRNWTPAGNTTPANSTVNLANVTADLKTLVGFLQDGNVRMLRPGFIGHPRTFRYLQFVLDGNGNRAFPEIAQGTLLGYPFRQTTLVPKNLGGGADESELYFADFADVVIAEVPMIVLEVSSDATYHDGSNLQSAFSRDETVVKMIIEHDLVVRHTESVAYLSAVKWS